MTTPPFNEKDKGRPTLAGALLMVISLAIIVTVAIPVVTWRDSESGMPFPRMVAILAPILAGALFYGAGTGVLKLFGIAVLKHDDESPDGNAEGKGDGRGDQRDG
jgi:hypothetical protein